MRDTLAIHTGFPSVGKGNPVPFKGTRALREPGVGTRCVLLKGNPVPSKGTRFSLREPGVGTRCVLLMCL